MAMLVLVSSAKLEKKKLCVEPFVVVFASIYLNTTHTVNYLAHDTYSASNLVLQKQIKYSEEKNLKNLAQKFEGWRNFLYPYFQYFRKNYVKSIKSGSLIVRTNKNAIRRSDANLSTNQIQFFENKRRWLIESSQSQFRGCFY